MPLRAGCQRKAVRYLALSLYAAVILGFAAQAAYVWSLHSPGDCYLTLQIACKERFVFFGSETGGTIMTLLTVGITVALSAVWLSYQIRFRLPALSGACCELVREGGVPGAAAACARGLWRSLGTHSTENLCDPDVGRVRHEFEQQRLRRAKAFANKTSLLLVMMLLYSVYNQFVKIWLDRSLEDALSWSYFGAKECVPILVGSTFIIVFEMDPCWLTPGTLDYGNIMCSCMWGWRLCMLPVKHYNYDKYWMIVARLMQASLCGNVGLTIFLNAAVLAIDVANMVYRPEVNIPIESVWGIYREVFVVCLVCGLSWAGDCMQWAEAKSVVQTQRSNISLTLVEQVLSCMCDAVPCLDADFRLARPCPSLSTLLLRDGPILPGAKFTDFISSEDAERLCSCLVRNPPRVSEVSGGSAVGSAGGRGSKILPYSFAGLCHVCLRGANSFNLPVSVFYSCASDLDSKPTFLLGIREDCADGATPAVAADRGRMPLGSSSSARLLAALPEDSPAEADYPHSVAWSSISGRSGGDDEESLEIWVDAASSNVRVLSCSLGFALLGGASGPCGSLSEWLSDSHASKIRAMLGSQPDVRPQCVRLLPPMGGAYKCEVSLCSDRSLPPQLEASLAPSCSPFLLVFRVKDFSGRRKESGGQSHHGGWQSANVQGAFLKDYATQDLDLVFTMQIEEGMEIGSILKGDGVLLDQLREHRRLQDWLEDPAGFIRSLVSALKSSIVGASRNVPREGVGTFGFKAPGGRSPPSAGFLAHVSILSFSGDERVNYPILLGLERARSSEAALERLCDGEPGAVSQRFARGTEAKPQLVGCASTHHAL